MESTQNLVNVALVLLGILLLVVLVRTLKGR
jgi:hypothetical protein